MQCSIQTVCYIRSVVKMPGIECDGRTYGDVRLHFVTAHPDIPDDHLVLALSTEQYFAAVYSNQ
jgi:hypothetical protein